MHAAPRQIEAWQLRPAAGPIEGCPPSVRGSAVDRAARAGKPLLEMRWRRDGDRLGRAAHIQPAACQQGKCPLLALVYFLLAHGVSVAVGRRVDDAQQTLTAMTVYPGAIVAILRADVSGRLSRHTRALEDIAELGGIVPREEHIVPDQREAVRLREHREGDG